MPTKAAMDAAIKEAKRQAVTETMARMRAVSEAREAVRPHVGNVDLALDSAESIYQLALENAGVSLDGVPKAAYKAMVSMLPAPGARRESTPRLAADAAAAKGFAERYPDAARIKSH